jgi:hypothetical protein
VFARGRVHQHISSSSYRPTTLLSAVCVQLRRGRRAVRVCARARRCSRTDFNPKTVSKRSRRTIAVRSRPTENNRIATRFLDFRAGGRNNDLGNRPRTFHENGAQATAEKSLCSTIGAWIISKFYEWFEEKKQIKKK